MLLQAFAIKKGKLSSLNEDLLVKMWITPLTITTDIIKAELL